MKVLLFGAEAAAVGERSVDLAVETITANELKEHIAQAYPDLTSIEACRVAVNQRFVDGDQELDDGDEIALVGPVSGG